MTVDQYLASHSVSELYLHDFHGSSTFGTAGKSPPKDALLEALKVRQRLLRLVMDSKSAMFLDQTSGKKNAKSNDADSIPDSFRQRAENDLKLIRKIEKAGLTSASRIAAMPEREFVTAFSKDRVDGEEQIRSLHQRAVRRRNGIFNIALTVRNQIASRYSRALLSDNTSKEVVDYFEGFPSYQDLFGSLNFCDCEHCQSIFSPAAYFLNVMDIVGTYITDQNDIPSDYTLEERRPDLFSLKLDCANTNDLVPFLEIVDDILAQRIESGSGGNNAYQVLATAKFPFNLPFNQPLVQIRAYLDSLETTLATLFGVFLVPPEGSSLVSPVAVAREALGLSVEQLSVITTPDDTQNSLAAYYGFRTPADISELDKVAVFTERSGLSRPQLIDLFTQNLSEAETQAGVADTFFINATGEGLPALTIVVDDTDPNAPYQKIDHLSNQRLDRLNRFIRLSSFFPGNYASLDWAMKAAGATEITNSVIENLAVLVQLKVDTGLNFNVLTAFWNDIKTIGQGNERYPEDTFDLIYNNQRLLDGADPYTSDTPFDPTRSYSWVIDDNTEPNSEYRARLTAALQVSSNDLSLAANYQVSLLGQTGTTLELDLAILSSLFRLTKQADLLDLSLDEFFLLAGLLFYPDQPYLEPPANAVPATVAGFEQLRSAAAWLDKSPFTIYELQYILTGTLSEYVFPGYLEQEVGPFINELAASSAGERLSAQSFVHDNVDMDLSQSVFDALVSQGFITDLGILLPKTADFDALSFLFPLNPLSFAIPDGLISDSESSAAFTQLIANTLIIPDGEEPPTAGVLSSTYTPETSLNFLFDGNPNAAAMQQQVREILNQVEDNIDNTVEVMGRARVLQTTVANTGLSQFLGTTPEMIALLVPFASGKADVADVLADLLTPLGNQPVPPGILQMIALLARANMLFVKLKFDLIQVEAVVKGPQYFNITDTTQLLFENIASLTAFLDLVSDFQDVNNVLIRCYFAIIPIGECSGATKLDVLANLTGWPKAQIQSLIDLFWSSDPANPEPWRTVAGLVVLQRVFALSAQTTMDIFTLQSLGGLSALSIDDDGSINAANWIKYVAASGTVLTAVNARYGTQEFDQVYRNIEGDLLVAQRDALVGYAVWLLSGNQQLAWISNTSDLSQYLLIDIDMSGCDSTSFIAQGIASVQLYMQRARMNLEVGVTRVPVPESWWLWLSAYRVWEANRKIYLYPENYADPELLQGASPIYYSFKDELIQNEIDDPHVTNAFNNYFSDLAEVANLVQCSSYLASVKDPITEADIETWYVLGRTRTDPYTFFHRSLTEEKVWSPWNKIDLSINAPCVSPVHAYGRLFIFWSEPTKVSSSNIKGSDAEAQASTHASLKFSFYDATGGWIQPQTLVKDYVINAYRPDYSVMTDDPDIAALFENDLLPWQNPHVFKVARGLPGTGRLTITADFNAASGIDTLFPQQLKIGDRIRCAGQERIVRTIGGANDEQLSVNDDWAMSAKNAEYIIIPQNPAQIQFLAFTGAGQITFTKDFNLVSGNADTNFQLQLSVGDRITAEGETRVVLIISNSQLTMDRNWGVGGKNVNYTITPQVYGPERLMILYGTPLNTAQAVDPGTQPKVDENPGRDQFIASRNEFNVDLFSTLILAGKISKFIIPGTQTAVAGDVSCGLAVTLTEAFEDVESRVLSLDWQYSQEPVNDLQPYRSLIDRNNSILKVSKSENAIADNYWGNSDAIVIQRLTPSEPGTAILYNIPSFLSWQANVSNQLGWFIFGTGNETFLATSNETGILKLSDMMIVRPYPTSAGNLNEQVISAGAYTPTPIAFDALKFTFTRLSTSTVDRLSTRLLALGLDGLLNLESQYLPELPFDRFYNDETGNPGDALDTENLPPILMDFNGSYGLYFWEVFFYNVFLVAQRLNGNQRFEEAKTWYEYIFNPTQPLNPDDLEPEDRFWRYRPFRNLDLESLTQILTDQAQIAVYQDDPFDPDAVARLRPGAYPKAIVMRYIDNLIDWADQLFTQDTRESITQATNLYVLALDLLGPRPEAIGSCPTQAAKSYNEIKAAYDTKGVAGAGSADSITLDQNASNQDYFYNGLLVEITAGTGNGQQRTIKDYDGATRVATVSRDWNDPTPVAGSTYQINGIPQFYIDIENATPLLARAELADVPFNDLDLYFCVPENEELMAYWDRVEGRLFKIRHCMNIEGMVRSLALFAPPIDPRELIRAAASGSLGAGGSVLSEPAIPYYRYEYMIEKAKSFTATVIQLGSSVLAAIEKQDAEALSLLRNSQEAGILNLTTKIKEKQIEEVDASGIGLIEAKNSAQARYDYYTGLLAQGLTTGEQQNLDAMGAALAFNILAGISKTASSIGYAVPQVGSPFAMTYGGAQIGAALNAASGVFEIGSMVSSYIAQRSLTTSGYQRRAQENTLQQTLADYDILQADAQIEASDIRKQIAQQELTVHLQQINDNQAMDDFLTRKFTNEQLYQWMVTRLSNVYFQAYSLAFDLAHSAQRAYQYQLGTNQSFLDFGYWNSLKKGLSAGDSLMLALDQLDSAFMEENSRPFEIERTVPLSQLDPIALLDLKSTGECLFNFPEKLFDDDYPGHYLRRLTTISVSIPAVLGPYQNIKATVTQLSNQVVMKPSVEAVEFLLGGGDGEFGPDVLRSNWWPNQQVALSNGMNDSGLFELNFSDSRFLPFENTGAVSSWRLSMPPQTNRFDFNAITDVIFTLRYTAYNGGNKFRAEVVQLPQLSSYDGAVLLSLQQQYPDDWFAFMNDHPNPEQQTLSFPVPPSVIPDHLTEIMLTGFYFALMLAPGLTVPAGSEFITYKASDASGGSVPVVLGPRLDFSYTFAPALDFSGVFEGDRSVVFDLSATPDDLKKDGFLDPEKVLGIGLILDYQGTINWN